MVDPVSVSAVNVVRAALDDLLPGGSGASLELLPRVLRPKGLGGYVGLHPDPRGDLVVRWLEGIVAVSITAANNGDLETRRSAVIAAYAAADRADLRRSGIFRLHLDGLGEIEGSGQNDVTTYSQTLRFDIAAEYVQVPTAADHVIERVVRDSYIPRGGPLRPLYQRVFTADPLSDFEIVDDASASRDGPSAWSHDAGTGRLLQTSGIGGGADVFDADKPGTALVLRRPEARDGLLHMSLGSDGNGGIGVVFRWQGPDDFYFFLMDATQGYRMLACKVDGRFRRLDDGGGDGDQGYQVGAVHDLRLAFEGPDFEVALDGQTVLDGHDASIDGAGRVGLLARSCPHAFFHRLSLTGIGHR